MWHQSEGNSEICDLSLFEFSQLVAQQMKPDEEQCMCGHFKIAKMLHTRHTYAPANYIMTCLTNAEHLKHLEHLEHLKVAMHAVKGTFHASECTYHVS